MTDQSWGSDSPQGPGWWQASDGKWYPPSAPSAAPPQPGPAAMPGPPGSPAYPAYPGYPGYPTAPQNNQNAVIALIMGIGGLVLCAALGIPAVIFGKKAKEEIVNSGGTQTGEGMATAGVVLGWIAIALMILAVVAVLAIIIIAAVASDDTNSFDLIRPPL